MRLPVPGIRIVNLAALLAASPSLASAQGAQAAGFTDRAAALGTRVRVLAQALSHREINERLEEQSAYTDAVESSLSSLDAAIAALARR